MKFIKKYLGYNYPCASYRPTNNFGLFLSVGLYTGHCDRSIKIARFNNDIYMI